MIVLSINLWVHKLVNHLSVYIWHSRVYISIISTAYSNPPILIHSKTQNNWDFVTGWMPAGFYSPERIVFSGDLINIAVTSYNTMAGWCSYIHKIKCSHQSTLYQQCHQSLHGWRREMNAKLNRTTLDWKRTIQYHTGL